MGWISVVRKREELFEEVWTKPLVHVAKSLGVSDVAVAKACRKMDIPLPGRGYWARKAAGYKTKKPVLRSPKPSTVTSYVSTRYEADASELQTLTAIETQIESLASGFSITVPETQTDVHPLVKKSLPIWQKTKAADLDEALFLRSCLDMPASGPALERAARIMDALLRAFEEQGLGVEVTAPVQSGIRYKRVASQTLVHVQESTVGIAVTETIRRIPLPHRETSQPPGRFGYVPRPRREYDYQATGKLHLQVMNVQLPQRAETISDSKGIPVEQQLGRFVATVLVAGEVQRQERIRVEQERLARIREEERRNAIQKINAAHRSLLGDAKSRLRDWRLGRELLLFAEEVGKAAGTPQGAKGTKDVPDRWIEWARMIGAYLERKAVKDFGTLRTDEKGDELGGAYGYHGESTIRGTVRLAMSSVHKVLAREAEERKKYQRG